MVIAIIIVAIIVVIYYYKRNKKFRFDSIVMLNGAVGVGKTLLGVKLACNSINKAHAIWWRRTHIYCKLFPKKYSSKEEEPLLYSNIPLKNRFYVSLTTNVLLREVRPNYHSVIFIDESSLIATSLDYKDKDLSEKLSLFLKLVRHELHGSYRNLFGSYPNVIVTTQSKNDNHFAFDRTLNQVLYITKSINLPFFRVLWARDLLLIDSVENNFDDDIKESLSSRYFIVPKKYYKIYNSYALSFLTDDKEKTNTIVKDVDLKRPFYVPSVHLWKEIESSNKNIKEGVKNGK